MTDRYAVIGNPIAHSRSPAIHAAFARQTGQDIGYERLLAPLDGFESAVRAFAQAGGRGLNVTVPFKAQACALATQPSRRVVLAGAANTLSFEGDAILADNTDGIGLVRDLSHRLGVVLADARIVVLGAGGAASGVILPLLEAGARQILVVNRTEARAQALAAHFADPRISAAGFGALDAVVAADAVLVNATASGLSDERLPVPDAVFEAARFAYDMMYAAQPTAFLRQAAAQGCAGVADGLGMLVEQAAASFHLWRGVMPETAAVYQQLRDAIGGA